jgi:hypothetical protein
MGEGRSMTVLAFVRDPDAGLSRKLVPQLELLVQALGAARAELARVYGEKPAMAPRLRGPTGVLYPPAERLLHEALRDAAVILEHARALPR